MLLVCVCCTHVTHSVAAQEACFAAELWNLLRSLLPLLPAVNIGGLHMLLCRQSVFSNGVTALVTAINAAALYAALRLAIFALWVPFAVAWAAVRDAIAQTQFGQGGFVCWLVLAALSLTSPVTMQLVRCLRCLRSACMCCWRIGLNAWSRQNFVHPALAYVSLHVLGCVMLVRCCKERVCMCLRIDKSNQSRHGLPSIKTHIIHQI